MYYDISLIYFVIPILCLLFSFKRKSKVLGFILVVIIVFILYFSKNGADYDGYLSHYKMLEARIDITKIHGEILFKKYMKSFYYLGFSYDNFRIIHLTLFGIIMYYSIEKVSKNFFLSIYIIYSGYIAYLISTYRQAISISFLFFGVYLYKKNKLKLAILLNFIGMFFHISSIWPLIFFLLIYIKWNLIIDLNKKVIIFFLFSSFFLRIILFKFSSILLDLSGIIGREEHFQGYLDNGNNIVTFGIITRIVPLIFLLLFYKRDNIKRIIPEVNFYIFSIIAYIAVPVELIAGRLFNNGRILETIIFPYIFYTIKGNKRYLILIFIIFYYLLVLINQLLKQGGYYPYINILFN